MATQDLQYLLSKLQTIQKQLGGPMENLVKKDADEFNRIKLAVTENINFITKKQDERDEQMNKAGRNMAVIKAGIDISDRLNEADTQLREMIEALRRQRKNPKVGKSVCDVLVNVNKKFPASQIEVKEKQLENCRKMVNQLKIREEGGTIDSEEKPLSLTDMKIRLNGVESGRRKQNNVSRDLNQDEADALKAFQEKDKELDSMIMQIDEGLGMLKNKAIMMGDKIEEQEDMIGGLGNEIDKAVSGLETANARLKKILYQYRKPGQFCMDVVCLLILLGLIAVIIKISTQ